MFKLPYGKIGKLYIFSCEQLPHFARIWNKLCSNCHMEKLENYIFFPASSFHTIYPFSATSIPGTAKYLEGFALAKTFEDEAAGMGNAQVARVVSWWEEERSDDGTTLHEMVIFVWLIIAWNSIIFPAARASVVMLTAKAKSITERCANAHCS